MREVYTDPYATCQLVHNCSSKEPCGVNGVARFRLSPTCSLASAAPDGGFDHGPYFKGGNDEQV
jgi:hypothetical protein